MKKGYTHNIIRYIMIVLPFAFSMTSCDVHEFPEVPESRGFQLNIKYNPDFTLFTEWEHLYDGVKMHEIGFGEKYQNIPNKGVIRYIIRAYPKSAKQRIKSSYAKEFVFTRNIKDGYDCEFMLDLAPGNYTIMVWSDFIRHNGDTYSYDTDDFTKISLQGEHTGNNDYRDAFRGMADVVLPDDISEHKTIILDVDMQRPLAKYEFITMDLAEFIDKEYARAEEKEREQGASKAVGSDDAVTRVNIEDYKVIFYYYGFMQNTYNLHTDKHMDSSTGVFFESKLNRLSENEGTLGFDYVFANVPEPGVTVQIGVYDNENIQVALTEPIKIPLKRSHHTIIKGMFLSHKASGGVNISPEYAGDYNWIIP